MEKDINQNIMPHLSMFPRCEAAGNFVGHLVKRLVGFMPEVPLSPISDHEFKHPLDTPATPVTSVDWPGQTEFLADQGYDFDDRPPDAA